ncbi:NAD(+) diphosphatase [Primorskyibacter aestuariivivens]|uniref:NAD(+) diphosphatase n=1 Tax=Primorskyibacter aestuariivivens TaxID=1888912 RepID=UPI002301243F|nr:NAD(+) diphosphatase [Primorskyibacter aestuariivivens]MDA7429655.1 NAD(+) diphosphatase [Primorskyibacter aestuariivivens]
MKLAETVTFGGSALDRAAEIRGDAAAIARADADTATRAILLWRGKPLIDAADRLVRLPLDHSILPECSNERILLGRDDGALCFAYDLSAWTPDNLDTEALGQFVDRSEQSHPLLQETQVFAELRVIMTRLSPRDAELATTAKAILGWHESHRFCSRCGAESAMAMSGWERACGACGGKHFPRTDPVVIMLITHGNSVLMGRSPGWPEGMYSLLAGFVEPGETLEAAVRREVYEEAGITVGAVEYLASQPWPFPSSLMFGCRGDAMTRDITIDPLEIEDAQWISREDMAAAFAGEHPGILPARKGAIAHFLLRNWLADTLD